MKEKYPSEHWVGYSFLYDFGSEFLYGLSSFNSEWAFFMGNENFILSVLLNVRVANLVVEPHDQNKKVHRKISVYSKIVFLMQFSLIQLVIINCRT